MASIGTRAAFALGWWDGALFGEQSAREAAARRPELTTAAELDAYGQGTIDGALGDTFRRDLEALR